MGWIPKRDGYSWQTTGRLPPKSGSIATKRGNLLLKTVNKNIHSDVIWRFMIFSSLIVICNRKLNLHTGNDRLESSQGWFDYDYSGWLPGDFSLTLNSEVKNM
jgi:hypothetical protein